MAADVREPLALERAPADGGWRRATAPSGSASAKGAQVVHRQGRATVDVAFGYEKSGVSPTLTLDAEVPDVDVALVPRVVPVGRLRERTIAWLDRAFVRGTATNGRTELPRAGKEVSVRRRRGRFHRDGRRDRRDARLLPRLRAADQRVRARPTFHNQSIAADLTSGEVGGLRLVADPVPDGRLPRTRARDRGQAAGDLQKALAFMQASPLGPVIGDQFMGLSANGPAQYQVQLTLPILSDDVLATLSTPPPERDYTVRAALDGVNVSLPALRAPAQKVKGTFELHDYEVTVAGVRGTILDGPFELSALPGRTSRDVEAAVELTAKGRAGGAKLPAFIGLPSTIAMSGATDWELKGHIEKRRAGGAWPLQFDVASNLTGLVIQAPRPFAKAAPEARQTRVRLEIRARASTT